MKAVEFKNEYNLILRGFIHVPKKYENAVIILHGFPADCDIKPFRALAKSLAFFNNLVLRFDFNGCGKSEGKLEDSCFTKDQTDIKAAIDFVKKNYNPEDIILLGHSGGAIDASIYAHSDTRVSKTILMSGCSDLKTNAKNIFTKDEIESFKTKGYIEYNNPGHWWHKKRVKKSFYDELFTINIKKAIQNYKKPLLIIHGSKDEVLPIENAYELHKYANEPKKLLILNGADHAYSKFKYGIKVFFTVLKFIKAKNI